MGRCIVYYRNQAAAAYSSSYLIFLSLQFSNIKNFCHTFLRNCEALKVWTFLSTFTQELWGLEDWSLVNKWTVGRCFVYTGIRLLLLIHPFISSFFFLSNLQTLRIFVTLLSGTVRPRRLKRIPESGCCCLFVPLFFIFLSLQFSKIKIILSHFSQELCGLEGRNLVHTWTMGGCIVYTWIRLLLLIHPSVSSFFFLSNFQTLKIFVSLFSGTVRPRRLKLGRHLDNGWMCRVYRNQAAAAYSSLYFFFFFLSNFQTLNIFVTFFSGTVRPRRLKLCTHVDNEWMYSVYQNQAAAAYLSFYFFHFSFSPVFKH